MEKIKAGIYIDKDSRDNMNKLKDFGVRPNDFLDSVFSFSEDGLIKYIDLIKKFQNTSKIEIVNDELYCTTDVDKIRQFSQLSELDTEEIKNINLDNDISDFESIINTKTPKTDDEIMQEKILNLQEKHLNLLDRQKIMAKTLQILIKKDEINEKRIKDLEKRN